MTLKIFVVMQRLDSPGGSIETPLRAFATRNAAFEWMHGQAPGSSVIKTLKLVGISPMFRVVEVNLDTGPSNRSNGQSRLSSSAEVSPCNESR